MPLLSMARRYLFYQLKMLRRSHQARMRARKSQMRIEGCRRA